MDYSAILLRYIFGPYQGYDIVLDGGGIDKEKPKSLLKRLVGGKITVSYYVNENNLGEILYGSIPCISVEALNHLDKNVLLIITEKELKYKITKKVKVFYADALYRILNNFIPYSDNSKDYSSCRPFGHYESPYPDITKIGTDKICEQNILGVDLNTKHQKELFEEMVPYLSKLPIWGQNENEKPLRYFINNGYFCYSDAILLYYMIEKVRPQKIIEVGSGFSTAVILDTNEYYFNNLIDITCIEPYPERLKSLLKKQDNLRIRECKLQEINTEFFRTLEEGDILFIDSSHVASYRGDVNYLFFEILPILKEGVYIHIHDIHYPFEYKTEWVKQGRYYNESYLLRAFLQNNNDYSLEFWQDYMHFILKDRIQSLPKGGGSFWMKKIKGK